MRKLPPEIKADHKEQLRLAGIARRKRERLIREAYDAAILEREATAAADEISEKAKERLYPVKETSRDTIKVHNLNLLKVLPDQSATKLLLCPKMAPIDSQIDQEIKRVLKYGGSYQIAPEAIVVPTVSYCHGLKVKRWEEAAEVDF